MVVTVWVFTDKSIFLSPSYSVGDILLILLGSDKASIVATDVSMTVEEKWQRPIKPLNGNIIY